MTRWRVFALLHWLRLGATGIMKSKALAMKVSSVKKQDQRHAARPRSMVIDGFRDLPPFPPSCPNHWSHSAPTPSQKTWPSGEIKRYMWGKVFPRYRCACILSSLSLPLFLLISLSASLSLSLSFSLSHPIYVSIHFTSYFLSITHILINIFATLSSSFYSLFSV